MSRRYRLARPLLFALQPESSHRLALGALSSGLFGHGAPVADLRLRQTILGLVFANPLGIAAGFDKDAEAVAGLFALGFGFVEVGSVTPQPQAGNPRPRLFRLAADSAVINRMGFNSAGHAAVHRRLAGRRPAGIVGVNLGANRDSADKVADYVAGIRVFADVADYLVVNISSPNTPGLRDLQERDALARLLAAVRGARDAAPRRVPLLVKIAPDLDEAAIDAIATAVRASGIDAMVVSNTTVARDGLTDRRHADEAGGLSGRPLFARSTRVLARVRRAVGPEMTLIGVGGVDSAETAFAKIAAGANLVQLYTGMIYRGPGLLAEILDGLPRLLSERGFGTIAEAVATETEKWAR